MNQEQALNILKSGENVFLTGEAGSGKTYVLNKFIEHLHKQGASIAITASSGIAATHIGGRTVHSWSGLGIRETVDDQHMKKIVNNTPLADNIADTEVLIIDEISMLDGNRLDAINLIVKTVKKSSLPFGGMQVVLCGDFFQLPPISKDRDKNYAFSSIAWAELNLKICYLSGQFRQDDDTLLEILKAIRTNTVSDYHREHLISRIREPDDNNTNVTRLFTHNINVERINQKNLDNIPSDQIDYQMKTKGDKRAILSMLKGCLAPELLSLKEGAEVMFVANNFAKHYINGTRGQVIGFDDENKPIVKVGKREIVVEKHKWKLEEHDQTLAEITQYPLRLAWAITIHKSQGMSLNSATIDLSKAFEPGMGYVAISRIKDLAGLRLTGINNMAMQVDSDVAEFDVKIQEMSKRNI